MKRLFLTVAASALAIGALQTAHGLAIAQTAPQATPSAAPTATASPAPTFTMPAALPAPHTKGTATPAPPKDVDEKRVGISGVWEVQIQNDTNTVYTHFKIAQNGNALTGQYLDTNGKKYPLAGTVDGKDVHLTVVMPDGSLVFSGTVEGGMDMEGTIDSAKDIVGFTATYRPKYKWIDNLSPNPGLPGTP